MVEELPKAYEPKAVEEKWLEIWLKGDVFHAEPGTDKSGADKSKNFSIVIPPPNVTGSLHMGHALNNTLQDILVRYKRMEGFNVLWLPGTDHAGIATQNVVERELKKDGKKRQDLGREKFIEEVWKWKEKHGNQIVHQQKRLGASCDWSRERFTMDAGLSKAVREAFVRLHEKKLIYRDLYLINWCPRCLTALSDIEVEHDETRGHLWHIRYPVAGEGREIVVATTRPETLLGDTAVAVHPHDERYQDLIGKTLVLPLVNREIPIIADPRVDREFGTGAVKVTPAHDFNDFALGNDHNLERINVLTPDAHMNENAIHFAGQDRFECRKQIVQELEEKGFLVKVDEHKLSVGHCYRCKTVVEPYLSLQWFVRAKPLAERALAAVREGKTKFYPENWTRVYEQWMENIKDWCISRQIWWGHRIPAWYCEGDEDKACLIECKDPIVMREKPAQCPHCHSKNLRQEEDVLDTWFSSGLWPFSTLGWPDKTPELKAFYPTSVLVTGFDIIFFWVARMMMMGLEFMDEVPFEHVYIHALVRDAQGQKMSKSKGNVIDPLSIMDKFGTDAFRFTLAALAAQGRDIKLSENVIEGYRNFCNKIWNASRYALGKLGNFYAGQSDGGYQGEKGVLPLIKASIEVSSCERIDRWILMEFDQTLVSVRESLENYHFDDAAKTLYQFFWHTFCDWYLEFSKQDLNPQVLHFILEGSLKALHPFMPFITEEILQKMQTSPQPPPYKGGGERGRSYPKPSGWKFDKERGEIQKLIEVITALRTIRGENRIPIKTEVAPIFYSTDPSTRQLLDHNVEMVMKLTMSQKPSWASEKVKPRKMAHAVLSNLEIFLPLEGLVDIDAEVKRLEKEIGKLKEENDRRQKRLADENFVSRADPEVVEEEKGKLEEVRIKLSRLEETYKNIS